MDDKTAPTVKIYPIVIPDKISQEDKESFLALENLLNLENEKKAEEKDAYKGLGVGKLDVKLASLIKAYYKDANRIIVLLETGTGTLKNDFKEPRLTNKHRLDTNTFIIRSTLNKFLDNKDAKNISSFEIEKVRGVLASGNNNYTQIIKNLDILRDLQNGIARHEFQLPDGSTSTIRDARDSKPDQKSTENLSNATYLVNALRAAERLLQQEGKINPHIKAEIDFIKQAIVNDALNGQKIDKKMYQGLILGVCKDIPDAAKKINDLMDYGAFEDKPIHINTIGEVKGKGVFIESNVILLGITDTQKTMFERIAEAEIQNSPDPKMDALRYEWFDELPLHERMAIIKHAERIASGDCIIPNKLLESIPCLKNAYCKITYAKKPTDREVTEVMRSFQSGAVAFYGNGTDDQKQAIVNEMIEQYKTFLPGNTEVILNSYNTPQLSSSHVESVIVGQIANVKSASSAVTPFNGLRFVPGLGRLKPAGFQPILDEAGKHNKNQVITGLKTKAVALIGEWGLSLDHHRNFELAQVMTQLTFEINKANGPSGQQFCIAGFCKSGIDRTGSIQSYQSRQAAMSHLGITAGQQTAFNKSFSDAGHTQYIPSTNGGSAGAWGAKLWTVQQIEGRSEANKYGIRGIGTEIAEKNTKFKKVVVKGIDMVYDKIIADSKGKGLNEGQLKALGDILKDKNVSTGLKKEVFEFLTILNSSGFKTYLDEATLDYNQPNIISNVASYIKSPFLGSLATAMQSYSSVVPEKRNLETMLIDWLSFYTQSLNTLTEDRLGGAIKDKTLGIRIDEYGANIEKFEGIYPDKAIIEAVDLLKRYKNQLQKFEGRDLKAADPTIVKYSNLINYLRNAFSSDPVKQNKMLSLLIAYEQVNDMLKQIKEAFFNLLTNNKSITNNQGKNADEKGAQAVTSYSEDIKLMLFKTYALIQEGKLPPEYIEHLQNVINTPYTEFKAWADTNSSSQYQIHNFIAYVSSTNKHPMGFTTALQFVGNNSIESLRLKEAKQQPAKASALASTPIPAVSTIVKTQWYSVGATPASKQIITTDEKHSIKLAATTNPISRTQQRSQQTPSPAAAYHTDSRVPAAIDVKLPEPRERERVEEKTAEYTRRAEKHRQQTSSVSSPYPYVYGDEKLLPREEQRRQQYGVESLSPSMIPPVSLSDSSTPTQTASTTIATASTRGATARAVPASAAVSTPLRSALKTESKYRDDSKYGAAPSEIEVYPRIAPKPLQYADVESRLNTTDANKPRAKSKHSATKTDMRGNIEYKEDTAPASPPYGRSRGGSVQATHSSTPYQSSYPYPQPHYPMLPPTVEPKPKRSWYTTLSIAAMAAAVITLIPEVSVIVLPLLFSSGGILIIAAIAMIAYPIYKAITGNSEHVTTTRYSPPESYSVPTHEYQPSPTVEPKRPQHILAPHEREDFRTRAIESKAYRDSQRGA